VEVLEAAAMKVVAAAVAAVLAANLRMSHHQDRGRALAETRQWIAKVLRGMPYFASSCAYGILSYALRLLFLT
jgi:hypothetical protein